MKQIFCAITTILLLLIIYSAKPPKNYTFTFTDTQVQELWVALDNSNSPHSIIKELQSVIQTQYSEQIKKDSLQDKKP